MSGVESTKDGKIYLRKSMIESFNFCPYQFRRVYVEGKPIDANYKMIIGTRFHEFAYWFFDVCQGVEPDCWELLIPNKFYPYEQEMAAWFIAEERKRFHELNDDFPSFMPVQREIKLRDDSIALTGTCDRLDWVDRDNGIMAITEYKTGGSYDESSIINQLVFYKIIWENNIGLGNIRYLRYINPRRREYKLIPLPANCDDRVYLSISRLRKALREDIFPHKCSPAKHPICNMCDAEECGAYGV
jgi:CRISPR/Cas system-associated exonuclease Cas4 (RecB family)